MRTPTRIQMEAAECGAVALAIVLEHFGHVASIEDVRAAAGVSRDGTSAGQIARAARQYGLRVDGVRAEMDDLGALALPAILHWEFNHFVVLEAVRGDAVYINDPATGPRRLTRAEVDAAFTGVALMLEPGEDFKTTPPRPSILSMSWARLRGVRPALWLALGASLAMLLPNLLLPSFSGIFTDKIIVKRHTDWLTALLWCMLAVALLRAWTTWQREQHLLRAQTLVSADGSLSYMRHVLSLPFGFFQHRYAAEIAGRTALNDAISGTLVQNIASAGLGLITMLVYGAIMAVYDLGLTLLALGFAALSMLSLHVSQRMLSDGHRRVLVEDSRLTGLVNRGLTDLEVTTAEGTNDLVFNRILGQHAMVTSRRQGMLRNSAVLRALQHCLAGLGLAAVLVQGGYDIMDGLITVGMMVSFQGLMSLFGAPVAQLLNAGTALQDVRGNMERLDDVMHHPADDAGEATPVTGTAKPAIKGQITFRGLTFGYAHDRPPLLKDFDLDIAPGTSIALVGASGCGKSTLARLLLGQLQPWEGQILLDGKPLAQWPRAQRCAALAHVDQEIRLLSGSVQDNLTLWNPAIGQQTMMAAARDAVMDEALAQRPGGLAAAVAEDGANFSGGERQRLEIARALASGAQVLLFDEATSALDPPVERTLLERVLARHATLILISHRIAPLDLFDRIVVLQEGRIVQDGSFQALMAGPGPLRALQEG